MSIERSLRDYEEERRNSTKFISIEMEEFFKYQPLLLSPAEFDFFRKQEKTIFFDNRLENLVKLYTRFHPLAKVTEGDVMSDAGFTDWLNQNSLDQSFLEKGRRLAVPHWIDENREMIWDVIAVLPKNLQRQLQEASVSKMIDAKTQEILHNHVELIVLGASVGSTIALSLVPALGIEHITIVDPKKQDGVGSSRVGNPSYLDHGKPKAIALWHNLLKANPYLQAAAFPMAFGPQISDSVFKGTMPNNSERIVIIIEEMDNLEAKDFLRRQFREKFAGKKAIIISAADTGVSAVKVVAEEPQDPPYNGNALEFGPDPFALDSNPIAKVMKTYGLVTKRTLNPTPEDIAIPSELPDSLGRLLKGEINSFEQSGLASRLAAPVVGAMILAFVEGRLASKNVAVDLSKMVDNKWQNKKSIREIYKRIRDLQKILGIKLNPKKG